MAQAMQMPKGPTKRAPTYNCKAPQVTLAIRMSHTRARGKTSRKPSKTAVDPPTAWQRSFCQPDIVFLLAHLAFQNVESNLLLKSGVLRQGLQSRDYAQKGTHLLLMVRNEVWQPQYAAPWLML